MVSAVRAIQVAGDVVGVIVGVGVSVRVGFSVSATPSRGALGADQAD